MNNIIFVDNINNELDSLRWFTQRRSHTPHVAATRVTAGCSDCASKMGMWHHLPNVIEWSDKL